MSRTVKTRMHKRGVRSNSTRKRDWVARKPALKSVKPKLTKSTITGPDPMHCGGFDWEVKWGLNPNSNKANGWIVQKVRKVYFFWPCQSGKEILVVKKDRPMWEAWQVRNGKIYIGRSNSPHQKDSFFQGMVGNGVKGRVMMKGTAAFHQGLKLPSSFVSNNSQTNAGSLPSTLKDPGPLPGSIGTIPHSIIVGWNCCPGRSRSRRKTRILKAW